MIKTAVLHMLQCGFLVIFDEQIHMAYNLARNLSVVRSK